MYIVADISGTRTRVAGSRDLDAFGAPAIFDTPQAYESALKRLIGAVDSVKEGEPIEHAAIRPEA
ncbi:hypothetical protein D1O30_20970 [Methylocystis hirsuta]|uniref:ROK family protein n=1 Tax=Methylocystis hirsuta TaxID=369798 RepID=A0A3M9XJ41_9HYPH|nr:hypothetical protein D1O30_20970 [Methylocystis hirsuta]